MPLTADNPMVANELGAHVGGNFNASLGNGTGASAGYAWCIIVGAVFLLLVIGTAGRGIRL